jgi:hypothetical protein
MQLEVDLDAIPDLEDVGDALSMEFATNWSGVNGGSPEGRDSRASCDADKSGDLSDDDVIAQIMGPAPDGMVQARTFSFSFSR